MMQTRSAMFAVLIALGALGTAAMGPLGAAFHAIFG